MPQFIAHHSVIAICLIILLEEAGIPLFIPGDLLILFAGALSAHSLPQLGGWLVVLTLLSSLGSSVFFLAVRRGGRPLVERFGRYIHLGPEELARSEAWLTKRGWLGIVLARAVPIVRHPMVIACGLLDVSYRRYVSAQTVGSAIYTAVFLALGATVGPSLLESIHLPRLVVRLLWLLLIAVGLPALLWWLCTRARSEAPATTTTRRRVLGAVALASLAGTAALSATWATGATIAELLGSQRTLNLTVALAHWLVGRGLNAANAYVIIYSGVLVLCMLLGIIYDTLLRPQVAPHRITLLRQALMLAALGLVIFGGVLAPALAVPRLSPALAWWHAGGIGLPLVLVLGMLSYGITTVCGHTLAVATLAKRPPDAIT